MAKDIFGNELKIGDIVIQFLPPGMSYVVGKVIDVTDGGLSLPGQKGETPAQIVVRTETKLGYNPKLPIVPNVMAVRIPQDAERTDEVIDKAVAAAAKGAPAPNVTQINRGGK